MNDDRGAEFIKAVDERIGRRSATALRWLSVPHWISAEIIEELAGLEQDIDWNEAISDLSGYDLVERWQDSSWAVPNDVRGLVLRSVDRFQYVELSGIYARILGRVADNGGDIFDRVEETYHTLAYEPLRGLGMLVELGLDLKSEPLFAYDVLGKLADKGREQYSRLGETEASTIALDFFDLFRPGYRRRPREEAEILGKALSSAEWPNSRLRGEICLRYGLALLNLGSTSEAESKFNEALGIFINSGFSHGVADALRALGRAAFKQDMLGIASDRFLQARNISSELNLTISATHCTKSLAEISLFRGDLVMAGALLDEALQGFQEQGGFLGEANTRVALSQLLSMHGAFGSAQSHLDLASAIYSAVDQGQGIANCLKNEGFLHFERGQYSEAIQKLSEAAGLYERWGSASGEAGCKLWTAACEIRAGSPERGLQLLSDAQNGFRKVGDLFGQATSLREEGLALAALGRIQPSLDSLNQAERVFSAIGNQVEITATLIARGKILVRSRRISEEDRTLLVQQVGRAIELFTDLGCARFLYEAQELARLLEFDTVGRLDIDSPTDLSSDGVQKVSEALNVLLANAFALYLKTKNFHWHISGRNFHEYHMMLDEHSDAIFSSTDKLAERVRKIGGSTLKSISQVAKLQTIKDNNEDHVPAREMLRELMLDNKHIATQMRNAHLLCDEVGDFASASILERFIDETERRIWFLFEASRYQGNNVDPPVDRVETPERGGLKQRLT